MKIHPYHNGRGWVFDDPKTGLVAEGLVEGIDNILDMFTKEKKINRRKGLDIQFDKKPIPDYDILLTKMYEINNNGLMYGSVYHCARYEIDGWLCPSLYLYFFEAPEEIYIKAC